MSDEQKNKTFYQYRQALYNKKGEFIWNDMRGEAAALLAQGYQKSYIATEVGVSKKTIYTWLKEPEFEEEVDRLSLMLGVASKAFRLRLINQAIRKFKGENGELDVGDDSLLAYLKEARMQSEGVKLGIVTELATLIEEDTPLDRHRQERSDRLLEVEAKDTD